MKPPEYRPEFKALLDSLTRDELEALREASRNAWINEDWVFDKIAFIAEYRRKKGVK